MSLRLSPSDIRYTQDSIACKFRNGTTLTETISDLVKGTITPDGIPVISVYLKDGKYYSTDNRRLYVFKELQSRSQPDLKIRVHVTSAALPPSKFTTLNDGQSIKVRGPSSNNRLSMDFDDSSTDSDDFFWKDDGLYMDFDDSSTDSDDFFL
ncbi:uncharacterized protein LOC118767871 [Octopus sinensis]|uniref:Uncharacterized protein LOC118767871 n=1 Tax=Octopus sinensis TaxID=2607531 RepID=A0A7E6FNC2_9MOLL|nr:uncharacterized protein LOC118767871 [Octopus sinensis]